MLRGAGGLGRLRPLRACSLSLFAAWLFLTGCSARTHGSNQAPGLSAAGQRSSLPICSSLWIGTWIAAFAVGVLVVGADLVGRESATRPGTTKLPSQNRYNLPMEIFYTIAPFIVIALLFYYTVLAQTRGAEEGGPIPRSRIDVVGQKWSWTLQLQGS